MSADLTYTAEQKRHIEALCQRAYAQAWKDGQDRWKENIDGSRPTLVCAVGTIGAEERNQGLARTRGRSMSHTEVETLERELL